MYYTHCTPAHTYTTHIQIYPLTLYTHLHTAQKYTGTDTTHINYTHKLHKHATHTCYTNNTTQMHT